MVFAVQGVVKDYAWGACGSGCAVAFFGAAQGVPAAEPGTPQAELWLGAHPSAPAAVQAVADPQDVYAAAGESAKQMDNMLATLNVDMPYLLKVLSIEKCLSLQLHPDRETAKKLHEEDPTHYPDPYDKPEMSLALSDTFEMFCGFLKPREIYVLAQVIPFLRYKVVGEEMMARVDKGASFNKSRPERATSSVTEEEQPQHSSRSISETGFLRHVIERFYAIPQDEVEQGIAETLALDLSTVDYAKIKRVKKGALAGIFSSVMHMANAPTDSSDDKLKKLVTSCMETFRYVQQIFPTDRGCFASFLLAKHTLKSGESIGIPANTIHAYIKGECLEIMKCSDNVIRAGLTPKFQDTERLIALTEYRRFKEASMKHTRVHKSDVSEYNCWQPQFTDSFNLRLLKVAPHQKVACPALEEDGKKTEEPTASLVLAVGGSGWVDIGGTEYALTAGQCLMLTGDERVTNVRTAEKKSPKGYLIHEGDALVLAFANGVCEDGLSRKRRTSVTASNLVETNIAV